MTAALLWMRHGTSDDGLRQPAAHARPDTPLTIVGVIETEFTARALRDQHWRPVLVLTSPLRRARQTAAITARILGAALAPPLTVFAEWHAPHCVLGRTPQHYPPEYRTWREQRTQQPDSALPGGESLQQFADRAREAQHIAQRLANEHGAILIVSHRLLIGAIAACHLGERQPAEIFQHASDFRLGPAQLWTQAEETTKICPKWNRGAALPVNEKLPKRWVSSRVSSPQPPPVAPLD